jgi:2'-5' RNA ligase
MNDEKRLFISAEVIGSWPREFPPGRILSEESRHITMAFLGLTSLSHLLEEPFPIPPFHLGPAGYCKELKFLPSRHDARVVAAEAEFFQPDFLTYQKELEQSLKSRGYLKHEMRTFYPHISISRTPFNAEDWDNFTCKIPFYIGSISLMESLGNARYEPVWRHPLTAPFEEIEHTADIAFLIRGKDFRELWFHAQLALAFKFPPLVDFFSRESDFPTLDTVIAALNNLIARIDLDRGAPLKAVSYHDKISSHPNYLEWKMIVDV